MYIDEENQQVTIQHYMKPNIVEFQDYRYSFQVVLDCEANSIRMNYDQANGWSNHVSGSIWLENLDGTG